MKPVNKKKTLLIIEDDEEYIEILEEICREALAPLRISEQVDEETDLYLAVAQTPEEAREALGNSNDVYLATVDINLSGVPRGRAAEGMEILEEMKTSCPYACAIIVSSEDPGLHMRRALREHGAIDFFQKSELSSKETEFKDLLKNTMIYAEAVRLFNNEKQWSLAEQTWCVLVNAYPGFKDNDVKNLDELLKNKKSDVTTLPGQEWIQTELRHLFNQDISQSKWAIVIVDLHNFKPFQERDFGEAVNVLKMAAHILQGIQKEIGDTTPPSLSDLLLRLQGQPDHKKSTINAFLGEVDNTGRFVFVTPSQGIAAKAKDLIDKRLTGETFKPHYRLIGGKKAKRESDVGYFMSQGRKVDLMSVSTRIITSNDISESKPPADVKEFEERIFGQPTSESFLESIIKKLKSLIFRS